MGKSIKVLQEKDIKGFTLLELLVVVALIAIVSAIGVPNFTNWKKDREVRVAAERVAGVISGMNAQAKRGTYPLVMVHMNYNSSTKGIYVTGRGMLKSELSKILNSGNIFPKCNSKSMIQKMDPYLFEYKLEKIGINLSGDGGQICFSQDEKYYQTTGKITSNTAIKLDNSTTKIKRYIIVCSQSDTGNTGICDPKNLAKPAYLISWSRFGNVRQFRWNDGEWVR